jgi:hypothetical protein
MSSPNLQLSVTRGQFVITPLPSQVDSRCTFDGCQKRATHRLLSQQRTPTVKLFCDGHAISWAGDHGLHITTARLDDSAA